jgi:hypothetical protein
MIVVGPFCPLVAIPRIRISKAAPGEPEVDVTLTPETVPCNACSILALKFQCFAIYNRHSTGNFSSFLTITNNNNFVQTLASPTKETRVISCDLIFKILKTNISKTSVEPMEDPLRKLPSKSVGTFFGVLNLNIYAWYSQRFFSFTT